MKSNRQRSNWWMDAVMFGGFLLALWLDLTGVVVHQWLGVGVAALAGWHLVRHSDWVKAVTPRLFGRTSPRARIFYGIDAGLFVGLLTISVTGLVISTWANLALTNYAAWRSVHVAASVLTLGLVVAKIGLHWRWIVSVAQRHVFSPAAPAGNPALVPAAVPVRVDRREFIKLMGVVGVASVLTAANALGGDRGVAAADEVAESTAVEATTVVRSERSRGQSSRSTSAAAGACAVQCNRRCSYPGHCRRYVDSNGNSRCDLGECMS